MVKKKEIRGSKYFLCNDIVSFDFAFGHLFVRKVIEMYVEKHGHIPKWVILDFITYDTLLHWIGSEDLNNIKLDNKDRNYETLTPSSGLLSEEMIDFFDKQPGQEYIKNFEKSSDK